MCAYIYTTNFIYYGAEISALGPSVPLLSKKINMPETSFGLVFTCRGIGYLISAWLGGKVEGKYDMHRLLVITGIV